MPWLNIYPCMNAIEDNELVGYVYATREEAQNSAGPRMLACVPCGDNVWEDATGITLLDENSVPRTSSPNVPA